VITLEIMAEVMEFAVSLRNPVLDFIFTLITMIGEDIFFILVVACFYWCLDKDFGYKLGFAYLTSGFINMWIKELMRIPRPFEVLDIEPMRIETAGGYSFPSGHTQQASALIMSLMMKLRKKWLYIAGTVAIFLVACSRIYLGVHWPFDVLAGIAAAFLCVMYSNWLYDLSKKKNMPELLAALIIPTIAGMFFFQTETYFKVAGTVTGLWLGYIVETRFIGFRTEGPVWKQVIKYVVGLAGLLVIKEVGKLVLPDSLLSDFIRYFIMGIWMTIIAPLLFRFTLGEVRAAAPRDINAI